MPAYLIQSDFLLRNKFCHLFPHHCVKRKSHIANARRVSWIFQQGQGEKTTTVTQNLLNIDHLTQLAHYSNHNFLNRFKLESFWNCLARLHYNLKLWKKWTGMRSSPGPFNCKYIHLYLLLVIRMKSKSFNLEALIDMQFYLTNF